MIFGLDYYLGILRRNSEEKIDGGVHVSWYGNTLKVILLAIILNDILVILFARTLLTVYFISFIILCFCIIFYISSRRAMFGVTENRFVYAKLKRIMLKEKEVDEILIDKIKYLDVKKILGIYFVKLYYFNDIGKFKKRKFMFMPYVIGFNYYEYKKNYKIVVDKLLSIQKVLDKGDF